MQLNNKGYIELSIGQLVATFAVATVMALLGVFLAYHTNLTSSNAWIKWGNNQAWVGDSFRLLVLSIFALLLVTVSFNVGRKPQNRIYRIYFNWRNLGIATVFLLTVTWLNFYYYPIYFELEVLSNKFSYFTASELLDIEVNYFGQIYKPFFTYYFYALPLWCFIILPTFLIFLNGFIDDYKCLLAALEQLRADKRVAFIEKKRNRSKEMAELKSELSGLEKLSKQCVECLRMLVQRYFPVLLVVLLGFGLGNLLLTGAVTVGDKMLAPIQTREAISSFAWVIIIFIAIFSILFYYLIKSFDQYRSILASRIDRLLDEVESRKLDHGFWDLIQERSKSWDPREIDILRFLMSTFINRGVIHLPILIVVTLALFTIILNGYFQAIIPLSVEEFIQKYFLRDQPTPLPET